MGQPGASAHRWSWPEWLLLAALALPFLVAAVALLTGPYVDAGFVGDNALNQLRVADVGRYAVLTGPFSRGTWSHPGPLLYYVLAGPYRLFGGRAVGMMIGALAVNGGAALGIVLIARRLGGRLLMGLVGLAVAVVLGSLGPSYLRDPWNPFLTVLPYGLVVLAAWALATGRWWHLPVVAVVGTFCVQSHVGYVPLVLPLAAWALVAAFLSDRRAPAGTGTATRAALAPGLTALGALAVLWLPPVVDQVSGDGNLEQARAYLMAGHATRGFGAALRVVGEAYSIAGGWVTGTHDVHRLTGEPTTLHATPVPVIALGFVLVALLTWRRADRTARLGAVALAIAGATAFLAVAQTTGLLYDYRLRFLWVLAALTVAVTLWLALRERPASPVIALVAVLLAVGALARPIAAASTPDPPSVEYVRRFEALAPQVLDALPRGSGPYLVRAGGLAGGFYQSALALLLEDHDRRASFDDFPFYRLAVGAHRMQRGDPAATLVVAVGPDAVTLASQPDLVPVALWTARSGSHSTRELTALRRQLTAARAGDPSARAAVARLLRGSDTVVVFRRPTADPASASAPRPTVPGAPPSGTTP